MTRPAQRSMQNRNAGRPCRSLRHVLPLLLAGLLGWPGFVGAQTEVEYGLKAAYLVRLGLYVDWPAPVFVGPGAGLVVCVVGDDPFGPVLDRAAAGQRIGERALQVRRFKTVARDSGCHIAYLSGSDTLRAAQLVDALRGQPVLTVTDAARGTQVPGIVHFVVRDDRVRFEIDDEAAAQHGLQISSKLLGLAVSVRARSR